MTKIEYKKLRKMFRANGGYSLRWMSEPERAIFEYLESGKDHLKERELIIAYCKRQGLEYNVRHTTSRKGL